MPHHRIEQLEEALERRERGRARVRVARVQARLDRLGVPVAEVVEGQVVEFAHDVREVELVQVRLDRALRRRERARIQRSSSDDERSAASVPPFSSRPRLAFQSCSRACVPARSRLPRTSHPAPTPSSSSPYRVASAPYASICAIGIETRPEALRHAPPVGRMHERMDHDVLERHLAHGLEPAEDRAVTPRGG